MPIKIYHNPRCGKSRSALELIKNKREDIEIILYLKEPPTKEELTEVLSYLNIEPLELIRKGESIYKEQYKGKELSNDAWIEAMAQNPILIERPIVINKDQAVIGRPPELVLDII